MQRPLILSSLPLASEVVGERVRERGKAAGYRSPLQDFHPFPLAIGTTHASAISASMIQRAKFAQRFTEAEIKT